MMLSIVITLICLGMGFGMTSEKLMKEQWYAKDSYYQKLMIDKAKKYKNYSTLFLVGGALLLFYLLYKL